MLVSIVPTPDDYDYNGMPLMRNIGMIKPAERLLKNIRNITKTFFKFKIEGTKVGYLTMKINGPFVHMKSAKITKLKIDMRNVEEITVDRADAFKLHILLKKNANYPLLKDEKHIVLIFNDIVDRDAIFFYLSIWQAYLDSVFSHPVNFNFPEIQSDKFRAMTRRH